MRNDFRALCAELLMALENAISIIYREDGTKHISTAEPIVNRARAALTDEPAVPQGREPASVTGQPSDEELADTYWKALHEYHDRTNSVLHSVGLRAVLARWGNPAPPPPADGEVAELVTELQSMATDADRRCRFSNAERLSRAAELLERLSPPQPVPVSERPWEREGWCDTDGLCWLGSLALDGSTPTWLYGPPAWAERFPNVHRVLLPTHALPLPEVGE